MPIHAGFQGKVAAGEEVTWGASVTANKNLGLVQNISFTPKNNIKRIRAIGGGRNVTRQVAGEFTLDGTIEFLPQGAYPWKYILGDVATSGGDPYTHSVTEADVIPSLTVAESHGGVGDKFTKTYDGVVIESATISASVGEAVSVTLNCLARSVTTGVVEPTVSIPATDPYMFYEGRLTVAGDVVATVSSIEFTVANNAELLNFINDQGTPKRAALRNVVKARDYDGTMEIAWESAALYEDFLGASAATVPQDSLAEIAISLVFTRATATDTITFALANCLFEDTNEPMAPEDIINQSLTFISKGVNSITIVDGTEFPWA